MLERVARMWPSGLSSQRSALRLIRMYGIRRSLSSLPQESRAAALIIGDEVLSGSVVDTNSPWLCKLMHSRGIDMARMEFVGDRTQDIQDSILRMKEAVGPQGVIFTSGGIGPTHDDVTYEAIAGAFGRDLAVHAETLERMKAHYGKKGQEVNESRLRMATLPQGSDVLFCNETWVPLVVLEGVHILPGIPRLFQMMLSAHASRFQGTQFHAASLFTGVGEGILAKPLSEVAVKHSGVRIGSYPKGEQGEYTVKIMVEGRSKQLVDAAVNEIEGVIKIDRKQWH